MIEITIIATVLYPFAVALVVLIDQRYMRREASRLNKRQVPATPTYLQLLKRTIRLQRALEVQNEFYHWTSLGRWAVFYD